ncbi:MAG: hypothetical protein C5B60_09455, partial [Chloroflexi bacterium]
MTARSSHHPLDGQLPADELQAEHLVPVARGGRNANGNLVPASRECNQMKCQKACAEFFRWLVLHDCDPGQDTFADSWKLPGEYIS